MTTSNRFEGLKTTGEWITFVEMLGRILSSDVGARSTYELANERTPSGIAFGIVDYMLATDEQIAEAKELIGQDTMAVESHFIDRFARKREEELTKGNHEQTDSDSLQSE